MTDWILIQANFPNTCVECGEHIDIGDSTYWKKGIGLKCYPECATGFTKDRSELVIIDDNFEDYLK